MGQFCELSKRVRNQRRICLLARLGDGLSSAVIASGGGECWLWWPWGTEWLQPSLRLGPPAHLRGEPGAHRPARPSSRAAVRPQPRGQHLAAGWLPQGQHRELAVGVAPNSLGAGAGRLPLARSQLPPPTQRGEPARHSRRALHSRGRLQGYPRLGASADCGHRPPRRSPPAPGVLPPQAVDFQARSRAGS